MSDASKPVGNITAQNINQGPIGIQTTLVDDSIALVDDSTALVGSPVSQSVTLGSNTSDNAPTARIVQYR